MVTSLVVKLLELDKNTIQTNKNEVSEYATIGKCFTPYRQYLSHITEYATRCHIHPLCCDEAICIRIHYIAVHMLWCLVVC